MLKEIKSAKDAVTTVDLFYEIIAAVTESGKWPDVIEYYIPAYDTPLLTYEFDPDFVLAPGAHEGYYLDLRIRGKATLKAGPSTFIELGIIKTLETDANSVRQMAALYGECLIAYQKIMQDNLDAFTRKGYDIYYINEEGARIPFGICEIENKEKALMCINRFKAEDPVKYLRCIIRSNLTRRETIV